MAQKADEIIKKRRLALIDQVSMFRNLNDEVTTPAKKITKASALKLLILFEVFKVTQSPID